MTEPLTTGTNGRFQPGNRAAVGHITKGQKLRAAMLKAVSEADVRAIVKALVLKAKDGDNHAIKILLQFIGKVTDAPVVAVPTETPEERMAKTVSIMERLRAGRTEAGQPG